MKTNWFNKTVDETLEQLGTNQKNGLKKEEVEKRQKEYGLNELATKKKKSTLVKFLEQLKILW